MPTSGNHEKVSESAEKLKYWEVKNLTDTKKFKELNADK
jgi:hypothetical protein